MKKLLVIASLALAMLLVSAVAFAQTLPDGYDDYEDDTTISTNTDAGTTFVQDLEEIRRKRIEQVIQLVRQGDPNVLRFIVYDVFEEVHKEILRKAREGKTTYYVVVGRQNAIPAYIGGFDNQDPRVRLRCIGWLGDWVDEIGLNLEDIKKRTSDRILSRIETRDEVKYGLRLLYLKIVRKIALNKIYNGDETVLETISADDFVPLVHDETFIRLMYCIPRRVKVRSIRLSPWWIDVDVLRNIVYYKLESTNMYRQDVFKDLYDKIDHYKPYNVATVSGSDISDAVINRDEELSDKSNDSGLRFPDQGNTVNDINYGYMITSRLRDQLVAEKSGYDNIRFEILGTYVPSALNNKDRSNFVGYIDEDGRWDIQSLYDIRYFNYSEDGKGFVRGDKGQQFDENKIVRAILSGLKNRHLIVRENCARLIVLLTDSYVIRDIAGRVVGVTGVLKDIAKEAKYKELVLEAFKDVRYSQYVDVARPASNVKIGNGNVVDNLTFYDIDGIMIDYNKVYPIGNEYNPWGYKWNYRIDIHEILRRMGLGAFLVCELEEQGKKAEVVTGEVSYYVESLFDVSQLDVSKISNDFNNPFYYIPDWHGVDVIDNEIYNNRP